jgi:hypothetical protein
LLSRNFNKIENNTISAKVAQVLWYFLFVLQVVARDFIFLFYFFSTKEFKNFKKIGVEKLECCFLFQYFFGFQEVQCFKERRQDVLFCFLF